MPTLVTEVAREALAKRAPVGRLGPASPCVAAAESDLLREQVRGSSHVARYRSTMLVAALMASPTFSSLPEPMMLCGSPSASRRSTRKCTCPPTSFGLCTLSWKPSASAVSTPSGSVRHLYWRNSIPFSHRLPNLLWAISRRPISAGVLQTPSRLASFPARSVVTPGSAVEPVAWLCSSLDFRLGRRSSPLPLSQDDPNRLDKIRLGGELWQRHLRRRKEEQRRQAAWRRGI